MAKEQADPRSSTVDDDDDALRCVACDHRISARSYRTERGGAHEHTFVNPHGISHHLGCFVAAPGCAYLGETEVAFSWFPGWSWQVACCARCRAHVGWIFRCGGEQFHGLIFDAVR